MRASAPTSAWAARSEAERAEREAGQIRPCNPTNRRSCAAGINCQISAAPRRTRGEVTANTQAPSHVTHPHSAEARRCRSATKAAFSFGPCTARFSFPQEGKENGGCIARPSSWQNPAHSGGFFAQDRIPLPISIRKPAVRLSQSPRLRSKRSVESPSNG